MYSLLEVVTLCNRDFGKHKGQLRHETETSAWLLKIGQVGGDTGPLTAPSETGAKVSSGEEQGKVWKLLSY